MITAIACALYVTLGFSAHTQVSPASDKGIDYWAYDINETRNPYGIGIIGYDRTFTLPAFNLSVTPAIELRHESSLATSQDHGVNSAAVLVTFRFLR